MIKHSSIYNLINLITKVSLADDLILVRQDLTGKFEDVFGHGKFEDTE